MNSTEVKSAKLQCKQKDRYGVLFIYLFRCLILGFLY